MIRTLLFSTLYPNGIRPGHGIFVEARLRNLLTTGEVEARVIAPVPWFPFRNPVFGEYARYAAVLHHEGLNGIEVDHPRYLVLPKIGMNWAPCALARAGLTAARRLIEQGFNFDIIDAHYFYPDGVAATTIGRVLNRPVVITARGSDINLIPQYERPRQLILNAARDCSAIVTVSTALKNSLIGLGVSAERITVLRNGVDLELFRPIDREQARAELGLNGGFVIASVGNLVELKGHHYVIEALGQLHDAELCIVGHGPMEHDLRVLAGQRGVSKRVHFLGALPQATLRNLYNAADCLVLASSREGWANVLLEGMACGTPAVATSVGGNSEVVAHPDAGVLIDERSANGVAQGITALRRQMPARASTRAYAEMFGWLPTTEGQLTIFHRILRRHRHA